MAFDGKALCCRVQLYLYQWQLPEIREAHQGGAFHFAQSQLWHFLTNAGDEGRSSRTTQPKLPPDPRQDPVPSEAAVPQRVSSPGWTHSRSPYSVKVLPSISSLSGMKRLFFKQNLFMERHNILLEKRFLFQQLQRVQAWASGGSAPRSPRFHRGENLNCSAKKKRQSFIHLWVR